MHLKSRGNICPCPGPLCPLDFESCHIGKQMYQMPAEPKVGLLVTIDHPKQYKRQSSQSPTGHNAIWDVLNNGSASYSSHYTADLPSELQTDSSTLNTKY